MHLLANVKKPAIVTYHSDIIRQKALHHALQAITGLVPVINGSNCLHIT